MINGNEERINSDLDNEDDANETNSSSVITPKEALSFLEKVHVFATFNDEGDT